MVDEASGTGAVSDFGKAERCMVRILGQSGGGCDGIEGGGAGAIRLAAAD